MNSLWHVHLCHNTWSEMKDARLQWGQTGASDTQRFQTFSSAPSSMMKLIRPVCWAPRGHVLWQTFTVYEIFRVTLSGAAHPCGSSMLPKAVEGGWVTGCWVICMAPLFKRGCRCRSLCTDEWISPPSTDDLEPSPSPFAKLHELWVSPLIAHFLLDGSALGRCVEEYTVARYVLPPKIKEEDLWKYLDMETFVPAGN